LVAFATERYRARKRRRFCTYSPASISRADAEDAICGRRQAAGGGGTESGSAAGEEEEEVVVADERIVAVC
jgi:hypothetical protein